MISLGGVTTDPITALGAVAIVVANTILYLQSKKQTKKVESVQRTLTVPNGGSHVKDQLDRMESHLERIDMRADMTDRSLMRMENRFNRHMEWSADYVEKQDRRYDELERKFNGEG